MSRGMAVEWYNPKHEVRDDLTPFIDALVEEVARHVPEKGYGYRNSEWADWFIERAHDLIHRYQENPDNPDEALNVAAMVAFAWSPQTGKWAVYNQEKRPET